MRQHLPLICPTSPVSRRKRTRWTKMSVCLPAKRARSSAAKNVANSGTKFPPELSAPAAKVNHDGLSIHITDPSLTSYLEYIGQLEGEVAAKVQEANDLRAQNRQLMEENTRLTDLTRMLLSSQAFSGFLSELSQNGMPAPTPATTTSAVASQPQPQPTKKDVNPHQATRQAQNQQTTVGMTMVPESTIDFSLLDSIPTNNWNASFGMNSYQVCAVTELPEGPTIDINFLSGKNSYDVTKSSSSAAKNYPVLQFPPIIKQQDSNPPPTQANDLSELDTPAFTLFIDQTKAAALPVEQSAASNHSASNNLSTSAQPDLEESEADRWARLESMCSTLDVSCEYLSAHTAHIS